MVRCICPCCRSSHEDIVPAYVAHRHKDETMRAPRVVCDFCFGRSHGPAAMRAYQALRARLKGE